MYGAKFVFVLVMAKLTVASALRDEDFWPDMPMHRTMLQDKSPLDNSLKEKFKRLLDRAVNDISDEDVEVYVGSHGDFYKEEDLDDQFQIENLYEDSENSIGRRKADEGIHGWHHNVGGWEKEGDDEVFLEPQPWMVEDEVEEDPQDTRSQDQSVDAWSTADTFPYIDSPSKRTAESLQDDYEYGLGSIEDYVRSRRTKGAEESISAVVDLLVLVDNSVYRKALEQYGNHKEAVKTIKKYYAVLVSLIDIRYAEIDDPSLDIRVTLSKIFIAKDRSSSPWSEYKLRRAEDDPRELVLDPSTGLNALREWLLVETKAALRNIDFDHAMAFTGYTLMSEKLKITTGMAYVSTICQIDEGYSCSILNERGGFINVGTAVHELGHSLGAKHDGQGANSVCPGSQNYIMAPFNTGDPAVLVNYFLFSPCSIWGFKTTLSSEQAVCLTDSSPGKQTGKKLPGEVYSPAVQCRDAFGPESGTCPHRGIQAPEAICVRLWCLKPAGEGTCISKAGLSALYGTPCGKFKICRQGHCMRKRSVLAKTNKSKNRKLKKFKAKAKTSSLNSASIPETNPQTPCVNDKNRDYCYQVVASRPDTCNRIDIRRYCCYSCYYAGERK